MCWLFYLFNVPNFKSMKLLNRKIRPIKTDKSESIDKENKYTREYVILGTLFIFSFVVSLLVMRPNEVNILAATENQNPVSTSEMIINKKVDPISIKILVEDKITSLNEIKTVVASREKSYSKDNESRQSARLEFRNEESLIDKSRNSGNLFSGNERLYRNTESISRAKNNDISVKRSATVKHAANSSRANDNLSVRNTVASVSSNTSSSQSNNINRFVGEDNGVSNFVPPTSQSSTDSGLNINKGSVNYSGPVYGVYASTEYSSFAQYTSARNSAKAARGSNF